jgi:hypothetical protein
VKRSHCQHGVPLVENCGTCDQLAYDQAQAHLERLAELEAERHAYQGGDL